MLQDPRVSRMLFASSFLGISPALERKRVEFRDALTATFCTEADTDTNLSEADLTRLRYRGVAIAGVIDAIVYDWVLAPEHHPITEIQDTLASIVVLLATT